MTNLNESEGSSTFFTTTYTYDLAATRSDFTSGFSSLSLARRILRNLYIVPKTILLNTLRLSWEAVTFSFRYLLFIQNKVVSFVYFLEDTKDLIVRTLMWRRGLLFRPTTHGGVLVIASVALVVGSLFKTAVAPTDFTRDAVMAAQNTPDTIIPEGRPRSEVVSYTVKQGDNISSIATAYNVSIDSIKWASNLTTVDDVKPGGHLLIPPVTGVVHKVEAGETISSLASKFSADPQTIADYPFNYIDDSMALGVGQTLIIPGGTMPAPKPVYQAPLNPLPYIANGSGLLGWPLAGGAISQYPSWWHPAVDIAAPYGTPVYAAGSGSITSVAKTTTGFGWYIFIDYGNGYSSAYAHLSAIYVSVGQAVTRGQQVGAVGCSGFCTGPHLHFQVYHNGTSINPLSVL